MVIVQCPECEGINITQNCNCDAKCLDCGYESYMDCFHHIEVEGKFKRKKEKRIKK
jgi:hypothetical protein